MNKALLLGALGFAVLYASEAPEQTSSDVLMEADRAFYAAVAEGGADAWASWFAEDGAVVQEGVGEIRGREAIRAAAAFLDVPGVSLQWEPVRADIAASGDLGWTTGRFVSEGPGPDGTTARAEGIYVSIWRLQSDGTWKVVMDLGNPVTVPQ
jgi:ketosteroid isomerase-like protein